MAVMIQEPVHPRAAQLAVGHPAHERGILARHGGLIAVAVECPGLNLALVQLAPVEQAVEGVLVVVALGSNLADRRLERFGCHGLAHHGLAHHGLAQSAISMPSQAISQPAASTVARSGLSSRRAGLELFMCT